MGSAALSSNPSVFTHILKYLPKTKPAWKSFDFAEVKKSPYWSREDAVKADVTDVPNAAMAQCLLPPRLPKKWRSCQVGKKHARLGGKRQWNVTLPPKKYTVQFDVPLQRDTQQILTYKKM